MPIHVIYEWDETKRAVNIADHGIDFTVAEGFDWNSVVINVDDREDYGELREIATGFVGVRLHVLVFTRRGDRIRIISLRKADKKDVQVYVEEIRRQNLGRSAAQSAAPTRDDDR